MEPNAAKEILVWTGNGEEVPSSVFHEVDKILQGGNNRDEAVRVADDILQEALDIPDSEMTRYG